MIWLPALCSRLIRGSAIETTGVRAGRMSTRVRNISKRTPGVSSDWSFRVETVALSASPENYPRVVG